MTQNRSTAVMRAKYARDPDYDKLPNWTALYREHCPHRTDATSRHVKVIAEGLRAVRSPMRRALIDAGYEPDHMAEALEKTVEMLWEARRHLRYETLPKRGGKCRGRWVPATPVALPRTEG